MMMMMLMMFNGEVEVETPHNGRTVTPPFNGWKSASSSWKSGKGGFEQGRRGGAPTTEEQHSIDLVLRLPPRLHGMRSMWVAHGVGRL